MVSLSVIVANFEQMNLLILNFLLLTTNLVLSQKCTTKRSSNDQSNSPQQIASPTFYNPSAQASNPLQSPVFDLNLASSIESFPYVQQPNNEPKNQAVELQNVPVATNIQYQYQPILQEQKIPINPKYIQQQVTSAQNHAYVKHLPVVKLPIYGYHHLPVSPVVLNYQNYHKPALPVQQLAPQPQNYHIYSPYIKPAPLVQSHVYHPVPNRANTGLKAPPTPPKYHTNFQPIVQKEPQREEEKEEVNEDHENEEEEDDNNNYKKGFDFDEDFFKKSRYSFPRFEEEEEEKEKERGSYEVEDHENQEEDDEESMKRFVFSQPYSKKGNYKQYTKVPYQYNQQKRPKEEIKVLRYTKSSNLRPHEYYQGRGSETVPVVHKQKAFLQNWYYAKSTEN